MPGTRHATVVTPLNETLLLFSLKGRERLGQPYEYTAELLSETDELDLSALLGKSIQIELDLYDGRRREFNGVVTYFSLLGVRGRYTRYEAIVRPWLWLLTQTTNSRIFQNQSVPEVVKTIFAQHGLNDFVSHLGAEYRTLQYLVQYRESDFHFIQRILEQEGIYYYFTHEAGRHRLVLADSISSHEASPGYESVPYYPPEEGAARERDHIDGWLVSRQIRAGAFAVRDFDFERPSAQLGARLASPRGHAHDHYELYDYPGAFSSRPEAETQANLRLEAAQADFELIRGSGDARGLAAGALFALEKHPRDDQNKQYLLVETHYEISVSGYESVEANAARECRCEFVALDAKRTYRPARTIRKPVVEGPQTAIVVGHEGQEIWTDKYGRVKVQFHWDRLGSSNHESSCWVRVSQVWAGSGFGGIHLPRIGQEVIVDFLEGDPDRPIITGRVYNADNMPPYELPAHQTQSGIKSRSSKGGGPGNCNEIRFEDLAGSEEMYIQAEKDQNTRVKNSQSTTVGVNQTESVGANQTLSVGANQTLSVGANRTLSVGANETIAVLGARATTVSQSDTETYQSSRTTAVLQADSLTVSGPHTGTYQSGRVLTVTKDDHTTVNAGNKTTTVNEGTYFVGAKEFALDSKGGMLFTCPSGTLSAGPPPAGAAAGGAPSMLTLVATDALILQCGENSICIDKSGISIVGASSVSAFAGESCLDLASDSATLSGNNATVTSSGTTDVMGGRVNLRKSPKKVSKQIRKV
jgi:type VI secretion system secreted protein VgrG